MFLFQIFIDLSDDFITRFLLSRIREILLVNLREGFGRFDILQFHESGGEESVGIDRSLSDYVVEIIL